MSQSVLPRLPKWPFYAGDALLLLLAIWIVSGQPHPLGAWPLLLLVVCVAAGAWLCVTPFLVEYRAGLKLAESETLTAAVTQIDNLQSVSDQITIATAQWQTVQEHCAKSVTASKEIAQRMTAEAQAFAEFMQKANDSEKSHLRLEADKLRRGEGEWLQIVVRLLDHVHALYRAGVRSGQPALRDQLGSFQNACREIVRRVGLVAVEVNGDDPFDEKLHELAERDAQPASDAQIEETVATGFTFQGQVLRRPLVKLKSRPLQTAPPTPTESGSEPEPDPQLELGAGS